jgi:hypothetical protein
MARGRSPTVAMRAGTCCCQGWDVWILRVHLSEQAWHIQMFVDVCCFNVDSLHDLHVLRRV